ncbi:MAG: LysR substrate-binding domain-containing protein, partial [Luteibacter sp.]
NYFPRIRDAFRALQHATDQVMGERSASLRVSVPPTFGTKWLVPRLFRFFAKHPDIAVEVVTDGSEAGWDLAIDDRVIEGLEQTLLANTGYTPVCSPAVAAKIADAAMLAEHMLLHERSSRRAASAANWEQWFEQAGLDAGTISRDMAFGDGTMMLQAAIEGQGVALAQELLVAYDLAAGRLVAPFNLSFSAQHTYYVATSRDAAPLEAVGLFREWIFKEVRN